MEISENDQFQIQTFPKQDPILIQACWDIMRNEFDLEANVEISTHSAIPSQKGLKTSSAISTACIKAISDFFSLQLTNIEIIKRSIKASIDCHVSITGAADDAYASFLGGVVITETKTQSLLFHHKTDLPFDVVLLIPRFVNPKSNVREKLRDVENFDTAGFIEYIKNGQFFKVINKNTEFYGPHLLQNYEDIKNIRNLGAEVVGLNGAGPSLFALINRNGVSQFMKKMEHTFEEYQLIHTGIRSQVGV